MRTVHISSGDVQRKWFVVDLEGKTLGRAAARIALVLRGKHKPTFTPNADTGDFVIVVNADKFALTGKKRDTKVYRHHTGYMGGLKTASVSETAVRHPGQALTLAIAGMLPKNTLGKNMIKKLKVYATPEHPHAAQQPETLDLDKV